MKSIVIKHKRDSYRFVSHFEVYCDRVLVGYFTNNKSRFSAVGENYNFSPVNRSCDPFYTSNKKEMINKIEQIFNAKHNF